MIRRILQGFWVVFIFASAHVHGQQTGQPASRQTLVIVGSALFMPLMTDIARRFEGTHSGVRIEVRLTGVNEGLSMVRSGSAHIAMLQRALLADERDLFGHAIARDGVAFLVHRDNPVSNITSAELAGILTGRVSNWKVLRGPDAPIALAWRPGEGSTYFIVDYLKIKREQIRPTMLAEDNDASIKFAASNPNGITFASVSSAERSAKAGVSIKLLSFDGIPAMSRTIQNRAYSFSRPLLLVTRSLPDGLRKELIDYAGSPRVLDLQLKYGFVPYE